MWESIIGIALALIKWIFERKAAKKLSDKEFLEHIEAHQRKRRGAADQATDFEDNMQSGYDELNRRVKDGEKNQR